VPWRFHKLGIDPSHVERMHLAYEKACAVLELSPLPDQINEILVTKIVEFSKTEDDPDRLCERVLAYYRSGA
jgi:hypothetical protein